MEKATVSTSACYSTIVKRRPIQTTLLWSKVERGHASLMWRSEGSVSPPAVPPPPTATGAATSGAGHVCSTPAPGPLIARMGGHPALNLPWRPERRVVNVMAPVPRSPVTWKQTTVSNAWRKRSTASVSRCRDTAAGTAVCPSRSSWWSAQSQGRTQWTQSAASRVLRYQDARSAPAPCCVTGYRVETFAKLVRRILS